MAAFTTRVELHKANESNYDTLYEEMKKEGFTKTIKDGESGTVYDLPTAEYNKVGTYTRSEVLNSAKRAASKTGKTYSVLVTESDGRTWYNLDKTL